MMMIDEVGFYSPGLDRLMYQYGLSVAASPAVNTKRTTTYYSFVSLLRLTARVKQCKLTANVRSTTTHISQPQLCTWPETILRCCCQHLNPPIIITTIASDTDTIPIGLPSLKNWDIAGLSGRMSLGSRNSWVTRTPKCANLTDVRTHDRYVRSRARSSVSIYHGF